jgi:Tat protein translocase TatB subunit
MFDIGMSELLVIFIVALLVFGPKRLPELARALGKGLAEIKKSLNDAKRQVQTEFREIESQEKGGIGKGFADFKQTLQDVKKQVDAGYKDIITPLGQAQVPKLDEKAYEEEEEIEEEEEPEEEAEEEEIEEEEIEKEGEKDNKIIKEEETAKKESEKEKKA